MCSLKDKHGIARVLWKGMQRDVRIFLTKCITNYSIFWTNSKFIQRELQEMMRREKNFVLLLVVRILEFQEKYPGENRVFLDVDEAIGSFRYPTHGTNRVPVTVLRPSIIPLLRFIKERMPNTIIGLLSAREPKDMIKQLKDPNHLAKISSFISEIHSSSEDQDLVDSPNVDGKMEQLFKNELIGKCMVPTRAWRESSGHESFETWAKRNIGKAQALERIMRCYSCPTMVVDDLEYAKYLADGVYIDNSSRFFWP